jgi:peptidoglycan/xylan/chitin deacetylase (PgdA/CDA1 family)
MSKKIKTRKSSSSYLRVLTYHRIADPQATPELHPRLISATPKMFAAQMLHLAKRYQVVSMPQVITSLDHQQPLPKDAVLITFDDAYWDVKEFAWPILKRLGLPATLFVPTAYPDHPERAFWWDRLFRAFTQTTVQTSLSTSAGNLPMSDKKERADSLKKLQNHIKSLPFKDALLQIDRICSDLQYNEITVKSVLDWDELRQLQRQGATIGAHTRTHPILSQSSTNDIQEEIVGSQQDLQREIGLNWPIFCAPNGSQDERTLEILRTNAIRLAFTTRDGHNDLRYIDPLQLHRTNITPRTSLFLFRCRLWPAFSYIDQIRHRL